jgi:hypothetical protein
MFINFTKNRRIWTAVIAVFWMVSVLCGEIRGKAVTESYEQATIVLTLISEENATDTTSVWYLSMSAWPDEISNEKTVAFLWRFELTEGWEISSVWGIGAGEELSVTVGDGMMLIDGILHFESFSETPEILRIEAQTCTESTDICRLNVVSGKNDLIYYVDGAEGVRTCPYQIWNLSKETTDTETSEMPDTEDVWADTEAPIQWDMPIYAGCQETLPESDLFSVRFLFMGRGAPVICMEGGGLLFMKLTYPDTVEEWMGSQVRYHKTESRQGWSVCTFQNLSVHGNYVFLIDTQDEIIRIRYINGSYMGMDPVNDSFLS